MAQQDIWEKEYNEGKLLSKDDQPQSFIKKYLRKHRSKSGTEMSDWNVLDLGSGTGRNSNYLAENGANVFGLEIAENAVGIAKKRADDLGLKVEYLHQSIGDKYPFEDNYFDVVLDITSSNSLSEKEREVYIKEVSRVLKPAGAFFVRSLCLDGDKNAKNLIKNNPGPDHHTYVMPGLGLVERVFTREEFYKMYGEYFEIKKFDKFTTYTPFEGQSYKRNFFFAWMGKLVE